MTKSLSCLVFGLFLVPAPGTPILSVGSAIPVHRKSVCCFPPSAYCLLASAQAPSTGGTKKFSQAPGVVVDINRASPEDFKKLPGVGPELARQIVAYRQKHGPFRRVEELMAIRGIGHKMWKGIRSYIRVGPSADEKVR